MYLVYVSKSKSQNWNYFIKFFLLRYKIYINGKLRNK